MGFFDQIANILGAAHKVETVVENVAEHKKKDEEQENITLYQTSHLVEGTEYGDDDSEYIVSFMINDAFREAESHACEVTMLNTYSPNEEYGEEGKIPYIAIQSDDSVYEPMMEFKEKGTFKGAISLTPLGGKFYFKAKKEYYGDIMYFYGLDRCDGFWENNGLCLVYPKSYVGTPNEYDLMKVLDQVAESYEERRVN